jgi:hypothetical protein
MTGSEPDLIIANPALLVNINQLVKTYQSSFDLHNYLISDLRLYNLYGIQIRQLY